MDEHINIVRYEIIGKSEAWITRHHIDRFAVWLRRKLIGAARMMYNYNGLLGDHRPQFCNTKDTRSMDIRFTQEPKMKRARTKIIEI